MALVLVLAALALISFLVLVILTMARTEDRTSTAAAEISDVRTLADMPAQLVISQIRRATSELGVSHTWASQPGMIRVFPSEGTSIPGTARVKALECYKLYSASRMTVDGESFDPATEAQAFQNWESAPALYTDLNQAVMKTPVRTATNTSNKAGEEPKFIYPILDPSAVNSVEGFEITGTPPGSDTAKKRPLPMPALWLYVLKDGRIVAPSSGSGPNASFSNGPTKDNPIVGRIAFWTDDESCKLNLNTASEPAPWDTPRTNSKQDHLYAERQPARNEFHRQSGHPAYTALSPVFKSFTGKSTGSGVTNTVFTPKPDPDGQPGVDTVFNDYINAVHHLLPRAVTTEAGSYNGTKDNEPRNAAVTKRQRLYTTVDELLFSTDLDSERRRLPNSSGPSGTGYQVTEEDVRKARFFLTTRSAAPETTPFNRPKISLWTVQADPAEQTDIDRAMMFAASTADASGQRVPYFFQRAKSWKSESDPGSSQSPSADASLARNKQILGAMQTFGGLGAPGYASGSMDMKFGVPDRDRLLVSMFDILRWGVNPQNVESDQPASNFDYLPPSGEAAAWSSVPTEMGVGTGSDTVRGVGRFPTITEVAIVFAATRLEQGRPTKVQAFLVVQPYVASAGPPAIAARFQYKIRWGSKWTLKPKGGTTEPVDLGFKLKDDGLASLNGPGYISRVSFDTADISAANGPGGSTAHGHFVAQFLKADDGTARTVSNQGPGEMSETPRATDFPFASKEIELGQLEAAVQHLEFSGGEIELQIREDSASLAADEWRQTIRVKFPAMDVALPTNAQGHQIAERFRLQGGVLPLIKEGDVVISRVLDHRSLCGGDYRIACQMPKIPANLNAPSPVEWFQDSLNAANNIRHSLRDGRSSDAAELGIPGGSVGTVLGGITPAPVNPPAVSHGLMGALTAALNGNPRYGDWDNGPGTLEDGPYFSRFDFGNSITERAAPGTVASPVGGWFQRGGAFRSDEKSLNLAPLRQISSAISFGSLPSQVHTEPLRPWITLLFCPNPNARMTPANPSAETELGDHFGFGATSGGTRLPDHLWLEQFWMPVVEPRPLSAGFSTEGKVNMNYQIMPFTWIKRATAMHGALQGVRITAIPSADATGKAYNEGHHYKASKTAGQVLDKQYRYAVNAKETLKAFDEQRFAKGDIFRTPSEICEMFLVPKRMEGHDYGGVADPASVKWTEMTQWWNGAPNDPLAVDAFEATGDNTREAPYAQLYPRLCTRSNVYRVHFRVQLLKKSRATSPAEWDDTKDQVVAEYRGSSVVERYLDPHDKTIPDMIGTINSSDALDDYFRYRVVERQPFAP